MFGATAILAGTYKVIINQSNRFKRLLPLLLEVPGYEGVRIHPGNKDTNTLGCLLTGIYHPKIKDWVSNSRAEFEKLFRKMGAAEQEGEKVILTISR